MEESSSKFYPKESILEKPPEPLAADVRESRRKALAEEAAGFAGASRDYEIALKTLRAAREKEKKRQEAAKKKLRALAKEAGGLGDIRAIARQADIKLRSEFVDPELIKAESAARQAAGNARRIRDGAAGDLQAIHQNIKGMVKRALHEDTVDREQRRAAEFEMRLGKAEHALKAAEARVAPIARALEEAHNAARKV